MKHGSKSPQTSSVAVYSDGNTYSVTDFNCNELHGNTRAAIGIAATRQPGKFGTIWPNYAVAPAASYSISEQPDLMPPSAGPMISTYSLRPSVSRNANIPCSPGERLASCKDELWQTTPTETHISLQTSFAMNCTAIQQKRRSGSPPLEDQINDMNQTISPTY